MTLLNENSLVLSYFKKYFSEKNVKERRYVILHNDEL
jgi:hypothetical protein